jgi:hypothetical protein
VTGVARDLSLRELWLAIAALAALIVGLIAGGLSFIQDRRVPAAIIRGGVAFRRNDRLLARDLHLPRVTASHRRRPGDVRAGAGYCRESAGSAGRSVAMRTLVPGTVPRVKSPRG